MKRVLSATCFSQACLALSGFGLADGVGGWSQRARQPREDHCAKDIPQETEDGNLHLGHGNNNSLGCCYVF